MLFLAAILAFAPPTPLLTPIDAQTIERQILILTNAERAKHDLHELSDDAVLTAAARGHSEDMLRRNFFHHNNPDGEAPADRVERQEHRTARPPRDFALIAENIWMGAGYPAERIERIAGEIVYTWMNSPGHRSNILQPGARLLGVGVVVRNGSIYATQVFANVRTASASPRPRANPRP